jgi:hypothetical protein
MKKISFLFLKSAVLLISAFVLAGMIRFPQTEGRAANLDLYSIYADPIIIYTYIASIPFFVMLYQIFKIFGLAEKGKRFSKESLKTSRNIKICAVLIVGFILGGQALIVLNAKGEDAAGPIALGLYVSLVLIAIAIGSAIFEKRLLKSIRKK